MVLSFGLVERFWLGFAALALNGIWMFRLGLRCRLDLYRANDFKHTHRGPLDLKWGDANPPPKFDK